MAQDAQLASLLGHFDDWFRDLALEEPIDQFQLEATDPQHDADETPEDKAENVCKPTKKDKIKLGIISRTTTNWFKSLTKPLITDDGMNVGEDDLEACAREEEDEESQLDSFARELDLLLESQDDNYDTSNSRSTMRDNDYERQEAMQDIYYFSNHATDELALTDPEIGQCCTISTSASMHGRSTQAITVLQSSLCSSYQASGDLRASGGQQCLSLVAGPIIQTPMPPDHDYLSRPLATPLQRTPLACNRISRENSEPILYFMANRKRQKLATVLNTSALKRFARFSDRLRLLSCE